MHAITQHWTAENPPETSFAQTLHLLGTLSTPVDATVSRKVEKPRAGWAALRVNAGRMAVGRAVNALFAKNITLKRDTSRLDPHGWQLVRAELGQADTVGSVVGALSAQLGGAPVEVTESDAGCFTLTLKGTAAHIAVVRDAIIALGIPMQPKALLGVDDDDGAVRPTVVMGADGTIFASSVDGDEEEDFELVLD